VTRLGNPLLFTEVNFPQTDLRSSPTPLRFHQLRFHQLPLSSLLALVALASLLPVALLAAYGLKGYFARERAGELDKLSARAESLARAVDRELRGYIDLADIVARSRHLRTGDIEAFGDLARDAAGGANGPGGYFALIARSGQHLVNTRLPVGARLPRTINLEALRHVIATRRAAVGDLEISPTTRGFQFVTRVPVVVDGEVRYVLAFAPHHAHISDVLRDADWPQQWFASVVDGQGRIIARSNDNRIGPQSVWDAKRRALGLTGAGWLEGTDREGRDCVSAFQASELSNWYVYVWVPRDVLMAPERAARWPLFGGLAAALLASMLAAFVAGRSVQSAIGRVLQVARRLGQGQPVSFHNTHMREANEVGVALVKAARQIAMREEHARLLMRELSHRSKNLLAIVEVMARQSERASRSRAEFLERFGARIASLSKSHDLLVHRNWQGVPITELIRTQLVAFADPVEQRIKMDGPDLVLRPEASQNIGMALHELATNASKHGALSVPTGFVRLAWKEFRDSTGTARFEMRWQECSGPPVVAPASKGFGSAMLEFIVPSALSGRAHLDWKEDGLVWTLDVPAETAIAGRVEGVEEASAETSEG